MSIRWGDHRTRNTSRFSRSPRAFARSAQAQADWRYPTLRSGRYRDIVNSHGAADRHATQTIISPIRLYDALLSMAHDDGHAGAENAATRDYRLHSEDADVESLIISRRDEIIAGHRMSMMMAITSAPHIC